MIMHMCHHYLKLKEHYHPGFEVPLFILERGIHHFIGDLNTYSGKVIAGVTLTHRTFV